MSLPLGFTQRQLQIWGMKRDGLSLAEIARRLDVSRQAIHKVAGNVDEQVQQTLCQIASAAKIEVKHLDPVKGILLGYSYENENRVIITFSTKHGAQIWNYHADKCGNCQSLNACKEVILGEAEERGINLTKEEKESTPTQLAQIVFSKVIPGLEP